MKKIIACALVFSSLLAGCVVVPLGRPWHHDHDGYAERGDGWHEGGWRR